MLYGIRNTQYVSYSVWLEMLKAFFEKVLHVKEVMLMIV